MVAKAEALERRNRLYRADAAGDPGIPFVRLILLAAPAVLTLGMVVMPLILIVVVFVLPDRSGVPKRKPSWDSNRAVCRPRDVTSIDMGASRPNPSRVNVMAFLFALVKAVRSPAES